MPDVRGSADEDELVLRWQLSNFLDIVGGITMRKASTGSLHGGDARPEWYLSEAGVRQEYIPSVKLNHGHMQQSVENPA